MRLTQVLVAEEALKRSQVNVIFAVMTHVGEIFFLARHHELHVWELTIKGDRVEDQLFLFL